MHYHDGMAHSHDFDDPAHEHELASEFERIHGLRYIEGRETFELNSVGIDIGSSTSHLMFSRLVLERVSETLSSRFEVVERTVTYASPILLTPYVDGTTIDVHALGQFIDESYAAAGVERDGVDAGAVIATGEAAKKENAEAIVALFAEQAGKFVCATAGPNLEAMMAAYGSGAVALSAATGKTVLNVDVGGGTTKLGLVQNGKVTETFAINVGARLVAVDEGGRVTRIEDAARIVAQHLGIPFAMGQRLSAETRRALAEQLADCVAEAVARKGFSHLAEHLLLTEPLRYTGPLDAITCSGGVGEYIMGAETRGFGDLGPQLGAAIRSRLDALGVEIAPSVARIRATAIGAAQYTLQVSGTTIYITDPSLLPLHNLQVIAPHLPHVLTVDGVADALRTALRRGDVDGGDQPIAIAIHWDREPAYRSMRALADGIVAGLEAHGRASGPIVLAFDGDVGGMVGSILAREARPGSAVISVDELRLSDFDYIDIGAEIKHVRAVPVIIKSLIFRPEQPHTHEADHEALHRAGRRHGAYLKRRPARGRCGAVETARGQRRRALRPYVPDSGCRYRARTR
ncbi:MAG: ethanolamine utilization protein eutA [Chloroflexi bacterium]|nr:ethanolamine utilization protein eutA [Chloroflexota bacterium]